MRIRLWFAALILTLSGPLSAEPTKGLVSFTFDDASQAQFDHGLRLAKAHGLVGTLFVPTALMGDVAAPGDWSMTWDEVRDFQASGWEIGAHGRSHVRLTELDPVQLADEIEGAAQDITLQTGVVPVSFSSPFGAFTDATLDRIMGAYRAHLSWEGHGGRNPREGLDLRFIGRLEVLESMPAAEICGEMVHSAQEGTWLVLLFHGITEGEAGEYEVSTGKLDAIFACAAFLQERGVIEVKTVRDALNAIGEAN